MDEREPDFRATLGAVLEEPGAQDDAHLTPELLVAYHHGNLPPEIADAALEHLAACRRCGDLLLELTRLEDGGGEIDAEQAAGEEVRDDLESTRVLKSLKRRLEKEGNNEVSGTRLDSRMRGLAYGLAASLALAFGLGAWLSVLKGELRALRQPQINLSILHLEADGVTRGDGEEAVVRGDAERFVVILNPPSFPAAVEHRAEILADDGRRLWAGEGLRPTAEGTFYLELSRRLLPPGGYRIHLLRGDEVTAELALRVAP